MAAAFKPLIPLDEAWSRLHAAVVEHLGQTPRSTDVVDSFDALGRVLAEDVVSKVDVPPVDNSAMDGYAVRVADLPRAGQADADVVAAPDEAAMHERGVSPIEQVLQRVGQFGGDVARHAEAAIRRGCAWCGETWCGETWCGGSSCGGAWCGGTWCGGSWCGGT